MNQIIVSSATMLVDQLLTKTDTSQENPFKRANIVQNAATVGNAVPGSNNPFGDSFSQLNDNDLFGLEFDWIRQNNSNTSLSQNLGKFIFIQFKF